MNHRKGVKPMQNRQKQASLADRIPAKAWVAISLLTAMVLWWVLSIIPATSRAFPNAIKVFGNIKTMIDRGVLFKDISSSLISVFSGYVLGFVIALPVAILMAFSRLYLYVHWPTDILGGIVVGALVGWAGAKLVQLAADRLNRKKA